jgi:FixJ family two-component response regulator
MLYILERGDVTTGNLKDGSLPKKLPAIAIIDDDESVRASTSSLVRSHGYTVFTFASAKEFLRSDRLDDTSCIISDVRMPEMTGVELQSHLLSRGRHFPFIFITAFPEEGNFERAMKAGATCFLTKPFDGPSLIACLKTALEKHGGGTAR